eukprot:CAMPEP_0201872914 /NCGR_PEP_ID=MMETSP0902-20130614/5526_1 /ASSEMBLY_ACC=CAM_ASM_000551 /TAXON_ID=420261 /ORGANISM="Thalassiosira antarctica, Strain CCMP982" /LENGTH=236 /DNA_ID=CAMNT_0048399347 /DNA_START=50 /DNA_END=760 /DNA_ORIENTATION=+
MKLALVTLLATFANYTTAEVHSCACEAEEFGFQIDCEARGAMLNAMSFLTTNGCATDCSSADCEKNYLIVQSHHDYCPEENIPEDIEDGFHDYDVSCTACEISRAFTEGAPNCPAAKCDDNSGNDAYAAMAEAGCGTDCSSDACRDNYLTLLVTHDDCEHDTLSRASEEGLHDMERACVDVVCNSVDGADKQLVCEDDGHGHDDEDDHDGATKSGAATTVIAGATAALIGASMLLA